MDDDVCIIRCSEYWLLFVTVFFNTLDIIYFSSWSAKSSNKHESEFPFGVQVEAVGFNLARAVIYYNMLQEEAGVWRWIDRAVGCGNKDAGLQ